jgi:predicted HTH domain antitoxin
MVVFDLESQPDLRRLQNPISSSDPSARHGLGVEGLSLALDAFHEPVGAGDALEVTCGAVQCGGGSAMTSVTLQFPEGVFSALRRSPEEFARELRLAAAVHWYERGEISQEKAAEVAGLNRKQFLTALAREKADAFLVDFDDLKRELDLG